MTDEEKCQKIIDGISEYNAKNQTSYKGKSVVLLVGPTGVGKSTLIELIKSKPLNVEKVTLEDEDGNTQKKMVLHCEDSNIGHTDESKTQEPLEHTINGLIFLDCPGFDDSQGEVAEIIHSYQLFQIVKEVAQVKVLVVASDSEMKGKRANQLKETIKRTKQLIFGDPKKETKQLGLAITKCSNKKTFEEMSYNPKVTHQFGENIFLFPKPPNHFSGQYPVEKTGLKELLRFIYNQTTFIPISNPSVSLNDSSLLLLEKVSNKQVQKNDDLLKQLTDLIAKCHEELSDNCLGKIENINHTLSIFKNRLEKIKSLNKTLSSIKYTTKEFANTFRSTLDYNEEDIQNTLNSIAQTNEFSNYLKIIFNKDKITKKFQDSLFDFYENIMKDLKTQIRIMEDKLFNTSKNKFLTDFQQQLPKPETQVLLKGFNDHFNSFKESCNALNIDNNKKQQLLGDFEKEAKSIYESRVTLYDYYDKDNWEQNKDNFLSEFENQFSNMDDDQITLNDFNFYFNQVKEKQNDFTTFVVIIPGWKDINGQKFTKREKLLFEQAQKYYNSQVSKQKLAKNERWQKLKPKLIKDLESLLPDPESDTSLESLQFYINKVKEKNPIKLDQVEEEAFQADASHIYKLTKDNISMVKKEKWGINKTNFLINFQNKLHGFDFSKYSFNEAFNQVKSNFNISIDPYHDSELRNEANLIFLKSQSDYNNRKEQEKVNDDYKDLINKLQEERKKKIDYRDYKRYYTTTWNEGTKSDYYTHKWTETWRKKLDGNGCILSEEFVDKIAGSDTFYYTNTYKMVNDNDLKFFSNFTKANSQKYPTYKNGQVTGYIKIYTYDK